MQTHTPWWYIFVVVIGNKQPLFLLSTYKFQLLLLLCGTAVT